MDDSKIIEWVLLYCKEQLTSTEAEELRRWLDEDKKHEEVFREYLKKYRLSRQLAFWGRSDNTEAWNRIRKQVHSSGFGVKKRMLRYYPYAALFFLFFSVSVYLYFKQDILLPKEESVAIMPGATKAILQLSDGKQIDLSRDSLLQFVEVNGVVIKKDGTSGIHYLADQGDVNEDSLFHTIIVPRGGEYFMQLSDGTKVWLNSDSKLVYPVFFGKGAREVQLEGEGYFEVTKDAHRPFRVTSRGTEIRVLGTSFNISAYSLQERVITTLVEGRVGVSNGRDSLVLKPGEQSISDAMTINVKEVDVKTYIAWKSGVFEFEELPLRQITDQLERWYDVQFIYTDPSLQDILFTGAADRHRDMNIILEMIEKLSKVNFTEKNKIITISKK